MLETIIKDGIKMLKTIIDIMGYEQLLLLGLALLLGVIVSVIKWTLIINFLRGGRKWDWKMDYMIFM